jgi:hypothetical protein
MSDYQMGLAVDVRKDGLVDVHLLGVEPAHIEVLFAPKAVPHIQKVMFNAAARASDD